MTWSIIARDTSTGQLGIAVATKFFAVGARVPFIAARLGAIATQALVNPFYGIDGLKRLHEGGAPRDIVDGLVAADAGRETRQLHVMDAAGRIASHTGRECIDWCGHIEGNGSAGGDKRGKQSAALLIYGDEEWSELDLRVDDHADPLVELERLEAVSREHWAHFRKVLPTRKNPAGIIDRKSIDASIEAAVAGQK